MKTRQENIKIFEDTLKVPYNSKSIFLTSESIKEPSPIISNNIQIIWSKNTVKTILECPKDKKVAALNFADPFVPGGLVRQGEYTQEECLCRSSNLYRALRQKDIEDFYYKKNKIRNVSSNNIIYSPSVLFFKDDNGELISDIYNTRRCNIISCSAPIEHEEISDFELKCRMYKIIMLAIIDRNDILILGKWGCGAFGGDWQRYKKLWNEVISSLNLTK